MVQVQDCSKNLIEKLPEKFFNAIGSEHYQFKDGNNFFIQANFKSEYKDKALELVKKELAALIENPITEDELSKAKNVLNHVLHLLLKQFQKSVKAIGYYMTVCDDLKLIEDYLADLDSITVADLENSIRRYLSLNNAVISVLVPRGIVFDGNRI